MAAKMSVIGLIISSAPYLRSAMVRFPLILCIPLTIANTIHINFEGKKEKEEEFFAPNVISTLFLSLL